MSAFTPLELRDRAVRFLADRGTASEDELLSHVFGGPISAALRAKLAEPLLADPRLQRAADGWWSTRAPVPSTEIAEEFTALAVVATGPTPGRARVARIVALHMADGRVVERFDATLNPGRHVPRYVAERLGVEPDLLDAQASFVDVLDDLERFLGERPVLAQDAHLTWAFVQAEAHRLGRMLIEPRLLDVNEIATRTLNLTGKPTLSLVAAQLGISSTQIRRPDEEARVLSLVGVRLLSQNSAVSGPSAPERALLRRGSTARSLPEAPGVYVLRDRDQAPLYVGKARRLRSRLEAYVHRPLGPTRRFEGLVGAVHGVDSTPCETDLEALVLEEREIRRLQPRFNTVRRQHAPRCWIRLPAWRPKLAPPRLELSIGPSIADEEFVGPFRNEALAEQARALARDVFDLDRLRRVDVALYAARLSEAWRFLKGESGAAEASARRASIDLLRRVLAFDLASRLLPSDPRESRYAVVRLSPNVIEGFVIDRGVCCGWTTLADDADAFAFAQRLLAEHAPRTTTDDVDVVLRWFGAQRPPARLVWLPDDPLAAADAVEVATSYLMTWKAGAARVEDAADMLVDP